MMLIARCIVTQSKRISWWFLVFVLLRESPSFVNFPLVSGWWSHCAKSDNPSAWSCRDPRALKRICFGRVPWISAYLRGYPRLSAYFFPSYLSRVSFLPSSKRRKRREDFCFCNWYCSLNELFFFLSSFVFKNLFKIRFLYPGLLLYSFNYMNTLKYNYRTWI